MKVSVETLNGNHFFIEVQPTHTVVKVKEQIEEIHGAQTYPSELQELTYQGKVLNDKTTIEENEVRENTSLVLSMMLRERDIWGCDPQNPFTGPFSSLDVKWRKVVGRNINNVAVIPHSRVKDFMQGEAFLAGCEFKVASTDEKKKKKKKKKKESSKCKRRADATLEYNVYQCRYGPDDYREGGYTRKSRKPKKPSEKGCSGRPSKMVGCVCRFTVKRRCARPEVAMIIYNNQRHVNKFGSTCHGLPMWVCKKRRTIKIISQKFAKGE